MSNPQISIAFAGRNDNYGENYLDKLRLSIDSIQKALQYINYEIVLVDYNPPKHKKLLSKIFSSKKYSKVKHVLFTAKEHKKFKEMWKDAGAKVKYNTHKIPIDDVEFYPLFAYNISIKHCIGDYILVSGTDSLFPLQLGNFVDKLEPNVLYRSVLYELTDEIDKLLKIDINKIRIEEKILFENEPYNYNRKDKIWSSAGNFLLLDRNSWKEIGGFLPTNNPRLPMGDEQFIFYALVLGKKIKYVDFSIFNLTGKSGSKKMDKYSNFIFKDYNHWRETVKRENVNYIKHYKSNKEWVKFQRFAKHNPKDASNINKYYYIDITSYKEKFYKIKELFNSVLPDRFLI